MQVGNRSGDCGFNWNRLSKVVSRSVDNGVRYHIRIYFRHSTVADRLTQLVERWTTVQEISGSSPRPDQHSGS